MTRPLRFVLLFAIAALVAAACSDDGGVERNAENEIVEPGEESVFEFFVGDCISPDLSAGDAVEEIVAVPCSDPHTHQVYEIVDIGELTDDDDDDFDNAFDFDVYPGAAELERVGDRVCLATFSDFVGIDYFDSGYFFTYLYPTLDGWNSGREDREVVCIVGTTGEDLCWSLEGIGGTVGPPPGAEPCPVPETEAT